MKRFFVENLAAKGKKVLITGKELHHLKDVSRLKRGDDIIVFDGKGLEFLGSIELISKDAAHILLKKQLDTTRESPFEIILAQGIAKGEKMDFIIQKTTELGVSRVIPFVTSRTVPRADKEQAAKKAQRWQRIALEAAKQCGRNAVPQIEQLITFAEVLNTTFPGNKKYLKIISWEAEKKNSIKEILKPDGTSGCIALIGPEGGLSEAEVNQAKEKGFMPVSLGPRILRAETAAISMVTIIQYELGDMDGLEKCISENI